MTEDKFDEALAHNKEISKSKTVEERLEGLEAIVTAQGHLIAIQGTLISTFVDKLGLME